MFPKPTSRRLENDFTVAATPISTAFLPTVAFSSGVKCSYGPRVWFLLVLPFGGTMPSPSNTSFTSLSVSSIPSDGIALDKGPSGLGREALK